MKAIDEKNDLPGVMASATTTLERLVADLGVPINKFAAPDNRVVKRILVLLHLKSLNLSLHNKVWPRQVRPQHRL